jgi:hypothetical protein
LSIPQSSIRCCLQAAEAAPAGFAKARLRCVKTYSSKIYDLIGADTPLKSVSTPLDYWGLRVEPTPEDDAAAEAECEAAGDAARPLCLTHTAAAANGVLPDFGEPLFVLARPAETLASLQARRAAGSELDHALP